MIHFVVPERHRWLLEFARADVLEAMEGRHAQMFDPLEGSLLALGNALAEDHDWEAPRAALAHRSAAIPEHTDTRNPYPCLNMLVIFAEAMEGGDLAFPDGHRYVCQDGDVYAFDAQEPHSVTPMRATEKSGYRIGVAYYVPLAT